VNQTPKRGNSRSAHAYTTTLSQIATTTVSVSLLAGRKPST
jgi:hypothetical protein